MFVKNFLLHPFSSEKQQDVWDVLVPKHSIFLQAKILHDGIYVYYEVTDIEAVCEQKESFAILGPKAIIPKNSTFVVILDTIVESQQGQGILIFPIYKLH